MSAIDSIWLAAQIAGLTIGVVALATLPALLVVAYRTHEHHQRNRRRNQ